MKKLFYGLLAALLSTSAHAANCDLVIRQLDSFGSEVPRLVTVPAGCAGLSGVLMYDAGTTQPQIFTMNSTMAMSGSVVGVNVPASGNASSSQIVMGSDTRLSDARTPTAHTHPASQISDSTTVGRAVLTAVDAAAARTAIGAGTGNGSVTSVTAGTGLSGGTITTSGTISLPNTGTAGTYSGVTTDAQGRVTSGTVRSYSYAARTLNTCFQVSATRDAIVSYSIDIATSLSLTGGQAGTVYLRTYTNSGCSAGAQEVARFMNGNTGTLTIGLAINQNVTGGLNGLVQAGTWAQLVTENNTGSPTFTFRSAQEVLL